VREIDEATYRRRVSAPRCERPAPLAVRLAVLVVLAVAAWLVVLTVGRWLIW
jgi:hypothetical protein